MTHSLTLRLGATNGIGQHAHRDGTEIGAGARARIKAPAAGSSGTPTLSQNTGSAVTSIIHGHNAGDAKTLTPIPGHISIVRDITTGPVACRARITWSSGIQEIRNNFTSIAPTTNNISSTDAETIGVRSNGISWIHAKADILETCVPVKTIQKDTATNVGGADTTATHILFLLLILVRSAGIETFAPCETYSAAF